MTSPTPSNNASPLVTFAGVGAGSQLGTIVLYFLQTYGGHPVPETVGNCIVGFIAALFAYAIHKINNSN